MRTEERLSGSGGNCANQKTRLDGFPGAHIAPQMDDAERRVEQRHDVLLGQVLMVYAVDAGGSRATRILEAPLLQVSSGGLMVRSPIWFDVGARVALELTYLRESFRLVGRVRHASNTIGAYKIGISLEWPAETEE